MKNLVGRDISELFRDCPDCRSGGSLWDDRCPRCDGRGAVPVCPKCNSINVSVESRREYRDDTTVFYFSCRCGVKTVVKINAGGSIVSVVTEVIVDKSRDEVSRMIQVLSPTSPAPGCVCPECRGKGFVVDYMDSGAMLTCPECSGRGNVKASATVEPPMCPKHGLSKIPGTFYDVDVVNPDWVCPECRSEKEFKQDLAESAKRIKSQRLDSPAVETPNCLACGRAMELTPRGEVVEWACVNHECWRNRDLDLVQEEKAYFEDEGRRIAGNAAKVATEVLRRNAESAPEPVTVQELPDTVEVPPEVLARFRNLRNMRKL